MATTNETILSNIQAVLPTLDSVSVTAIYKKIASAIGAALDVFYAELLNTKNNIDTIIGEQRYGRRGYYEEKALAFQYGDTLDAVNSTTLDPEYSVIDTDKQIVKQVSFKADESTGYQLLTMKVNKIESGLLVPLSVDEKTSFDNYMENFEILGIPITKVSLNADTLNFTMKVTYFSTYDLNAIKTGIAAALITFRDTFRFNSVLFINDIEEYLKTNVSGIRSCYINFAEIKPYGESYTEITTGETELIGGHFNYSDTYTIDYVSV